MRKWIDLIEGTQGHIYGDEGLAKRLPEADQRVFTTTDGRVIELYNSGHEVSATIDGEKAGYLSLRNDAPMDNQGVATGADWWVHRAWVEEPFRRQGIATAMYDYAHYAGFRPLKRSHSQTDGGKGIWKKRGARAAWKLNESKIPTKLYHGSQKEFPVGFVLLPQSDGYIHATREDNAAHIMLEEVLERYRPEHCVPRDQAVYMCDDIDDIDYAGGYTDFVYIVEPDQRVTCCNLAWYSALYLLCEHETLSAQEAKAQGRDWYPDWEEPEVKTYALNYWNALPHGDDDLLEWLSPRAIVKEIVEK